MTGIGDGSIGLGGKPATADVVLEHLTEEFRANLAQGRTVPEGTVIDPMCGMLVGLGPRAITLDHDGRPSVSVPRPAGIPTPAGTRGRVDQYAGGMADLSEPPPDLADPGELLRQYLDLYWDTVWHKVEGLTEADLRRAVLPSGWSMLELLHHLLYVERRWLQWCFLGIGEDLPRGDWDLAAGRWAVPEGLAVATIRAEFWAEVERSRRVAADHSPATIAQRTRNEGQPPPTLAWILFHLLQEYARHAGHLDATRELIDGSTGE